MDNPAWHDIYTVRWIHGKPCKISLRNGFVRFFFRIFSEGSSTPSKDFTTSSFSFFSPQLLDNMSQYNRFTVCAFFCSFKIKKLMHQTATTLNNLQLWFLTASRHAGQHDQRKYLCPPPLDRLQEDCGSVVDRSVTLPCCYGQATFPTV